MSRFVVNINRKIAICFCIILSCVLLCSCEKSVNDSVKINNVDSEMYRPDGYVYEPGSIDILTWAGCYISGEVTNISNQTLNDIFVQVRYYKTTSLVTSSKKQYILEYKIRKLNPNETKTFKIKIDYEELGIFPVYGYDWEIHDVVIKK